MQKVVIGNALTFPNLAMRVSSPLLAVTTALSMLSAAAYSLAVSAIPPEITSEQYTKLSRLEPNQSIAVSELFPGSWTEVCLSGISAQLVEAGQMTWLQRQYYAQLADPYIRYVWFVLKNKNESTLVAVNVDLSSLVPSASKNVLPDGFRAKVSSVECAKNPGAKLRAYSVLGNKPIFLEN